MTDSNDCFFQDLALISDLTQVVSIIFTVVSGSFLVVGFALWLWCRTHVYLRKRGYVHLLFVSLGWGFNILVGPLARVLRETIFKGCFPQALMIGLILPFLTFPQALRVFQVTYNLKLNKEFSNLLKESLKNQVGYYLQNLSKQPEEYRSYIEDENEDASQVTNVQGRLFIYKKLGSNNFAALTGLLALVFTLLQGFGYATSLCPEVGRDKCLIVSNGLDSIVALLILYLSTFIFGLFTALLTFVIRNYEDPFDIVYEFKLAITPSLFLLVCFLGLSATDPFDISPEFDEDGIIIPNEIKFNYEVFLDVAIFYFGFVTVFIPAYKVWKARDKSPLNTNHITLAQVIESAKGEELFTNHLEAEFTLDNFFFYKRCLAWEATYFSARPQAVKKEAKSIYQNWVARGSLLEVNLPAEISEAIYLDIKDNSYHVDLFKEPREYVYDIMANTSFLRFKESERFQALFQEENVMFGIPESPSRKVVSPAFHMPE